MVGPFRRAQSGFTHHLVMVDKFTKWIEAKPVTSCDGATAKRFLEDVIIRYGYPHSIITDNGSNFSMGELANSATSKISGLTSRQSHIHRLTDKSKEEMV